MKLSLCVLDAFLCTPPPTARGPLLAKATLPIPANAFPFLFTDDPAPDLEEDRVVRVEVELYLEEDEAGVEVARCVWGYG